MNLNWIMLVTFTMYLSTASHLDCWDLRMGSETMTVLAPRWPSELCSASRGPHLGLRAAVVDDDVGDDLDAGVVQGAHQIPEVRLRPVRAVQVVQVRRQVPAARRASVTRQLSIREYTVVKALQGPDILHLAIHAAFVPMLIGSICQTPLVALQSSVTTMDDRRRHRLQTRG